MMMGFDIPFKITFGDVLLRTVKVIIQDNITFKFLILQNRYLERYQFTDVKYDLQGIIDNFLNPILLFQVF